MQPAIMEEWRVLRSEIARKQAFAEQILVTIGGANFAVIAYGVKDLSFEGVFVCLLPTIISSVAYLWLLTYIYSGFRIAAYIKTELEPKISGMNWENWLSANAGKFKFCIKNSYALLMNTFYCISLAASLLKIALLYTGSNPPAYPLVPLIIWVVVFWAVWILAVDLIFVRRAVRDIRNVHREIQGE